MARVFDAYRSVEQCLAASNQRKERVRFVREDAVMGLAPNYFGDMTIVICRPSIRGICSTLAISSRSSLTRIKTSMPNS